MSRIWKQPVKIPSNVKVEIKDWVIKVSWSKWELTQDFLTDYVKVEEDNWMIVVRKYEIVKKVQHFLD